MPKAIQIEMSLTLYDYLDMIGYMVDNENEAVENVYLQNIKTYEALTESAFQLDITFWMMIMYGIEDIFILYSAIISFFTLSKCLADRLASVRSNKEVEILSWDFAKAFFDTIIVFLLCIVGLMFLTISGEGPVPPIESMVLMVMLGHPCSWFVVLFFFKLFQNMTVYHLSLIAFFAEFGLNYLMNHVSKVVSTKYISIMTLFFRHLNFMIVLGMNLEFIMQQGIL